MLTFDKDGNIKGIFNIIKKPVDEILNHEKNKCQPVGCTPKTS